MESETCLLHNVTGYKVINRRSGNMANFSKTEGAGKRQRNNPEKPNIRKTT